MTIFKAKLNSTDNRMVEITQSFGQYEQVFAVVALDLFDTETQDRLYNRESIMFWLKEVE